MPCHIHDVFLNCDWLGFFLMQCDWSVILHQCHDIVCTFYVPCHVTCSMFLLCFAHFVGWKTAPCWNLPILAPSPPPYKQTFHSPPPQTFKGALWHLLVLSRLGYTLWFWSHTSTCFVSHMCGASLANIFRSDRPWYLILLRGSFFKYDDSNST